MRIPDLLARPTRFAAWPAPLAAAVLAVLLALVAWGMVSQAPRIGNPDAPRKAFVGAPQDIEPAGDDIMLYRSIVEAVRGGGNYYTVTAPLLRNNDYPLRPFVTFRLPTLAHMLAAIPHWAALGLMALLTGGVILGWSVRLAPALRTPEISSWTSLLLLVNCMTAASPVLVVFHESWAALLVALALALHRPDSAPQRWWPAVLIALIAIMIRELALPFILLMGALALWRRHWTEAAAWAAVTALFAVAITLHAGQVALVILPTDPASPGWSSMGGWPFLIGSVRAATVLTYLPVQITAILVPLALLGWAAWQHWTGLAAFVYLSGFALMMTLVGRPDNFYWALMISPMLLAGLIFTPTALRDLVVAARPRAALLS